MKLYINEADEHPTPRKGLWVGQLICKLKKMIETTHKVDEADVVVTGVRLVGRDAVTTWITYSIKCLSIPTLFWVSISDVAKYLNDLLPIPEPKLTIIRGLPGSGKTTKAMYLLEMEPDTDHFEADMYFINSDTGTYCFDRGQAQSAHDWCFDNTQLSLIHGRNVIVSNTFSRTWEYQRYLDLGYPTEVITMTGTYPNIHGVPQEAIDRMKERWEETPEGYERNSTNAG